MDEFKKTIQKGEHLVYFGATWCQNCKQMKNGLNEAMLSKKYSILIYDTDEDEDVTALCGVSKLPTILIWKNGRQVGKFEGGEECNIALIIQKHFTVFTEDYVLEEVSF
jgi:thioredoxin 1